ncbi:MAG: hypothetical protein DRJ08_07925 [Acidobacteria bacterium]|nr:MAG: hypothetical protein DRJ08_07925 [Acidobacteriota bacterium]
MRHKLSICHKEPAFHKTQFYEIGAFSKRAIELAQNEPFGESAVLSASDDSAGSGPISCFIQPG